MQGYRIYETLTGSVKRTWNGYVADDLEWPSKVISATGSLFKVQHRRTSNTLYVMYAVLVENQAW